MASRRILPSQTRQVLQRHLQAGDTPGLQGWADEREVRLDLFRWLHRYNTRRRHCSFGQRSPIAYETALETTSTPLAPADIAHVKDSWQWTWTSRTPAPSHSYGQRQDSPGLPVSETGASADACVICWAACGPWSNESDGVGSARDARREHRAPSQRRPNLAGQRCVCTVH